MFPKALGELGGKDVLIINCPKKEGTELQVPTHCCEVVTAGHASLYKECALELCILCIKLYLKCNSCLLEKFSGRLHCGNRNNYNIAINI